MLGVSQRLLTGPGAQDQAFLPAQTPKCAPQQPALIGRTPQPPYGRQLKGELRNKYSIYPYLHPHPLTPCNKGMYYTDFLFSEHGRPILCSTMR
ncbi:hypothetical protein CesoFtcFv8_022494 [Champsocephalus esox]|uniref:Uncharacterized protein n=2 Tax=Champsocephalus TaxID=52236 RepID=A0AAN8H894_CHAGU|nr:hypothetical protein CesoFtcFv8_022494 [Champsocephalus esox]KAK5906439.1 hypothetical protein CgunFtcFv8_002306 [Champsocephalus gunnari]